MTAVLQEDLLSFFCQLHHLTSLSVNEFGCKTEKRDLTLNYGQIPFPLLPRSTKWKREKKCLKALLVSVQWISWRFSKYSIKEEFGVFEKWLYLSSIWRASIRGLSEWKGPSQGNGQININITFSLGTPKLGGTLPQFMASTRCPFALLSKACSNALQCRECISKYQKFISNGIVFHLFLLSFCLLIFFCFLVSLL